LRLNKEISDKKLKSLNKNFKDILKQGVIQRAGPAEIELAAKEYIDLPRLSMRFNMHDFSRLSQLINAINKD